jgi:hypothetical protein
MLILFGFSILLLAFIVGAAAGALIKRPISGGVGGMLAVTLIGLVLFALFYYYIALPIERMG